MTDRGSKMNVINENQIFLKENFTNQDSVFQFLAKQTVELGISSDEKAVYDSLKSREAEGTTGMMDGFAIPHAKTTAVTKASILIVQLENGIEWNSMDGKFINFVIALFIPETEMGTTHLKLLSTIAKMLMRSEFKEQLQQATSKTEIVHLLNENLSEEK